MMDYIIAGLILWCIFLHGLLFHTRRMLAELARVCMFHAEQTKEIAALGMESSALMAHFIKECGKGGADFAAQESQKGGQLFSEPKS